MTDQLPSFLEEVRTLLGPDAPQLTRAEIAVVLDLARAAAHTAERRAAPITTYLAGMAVGRAAPETRIPFLEELVVKLELRAPAVEEAPRP